MARIEHFNALKDNKCLIFPKIWHQPKYLLHDPRSQKCITAQFSKRLRYKYIFEVLLNHIYPISSQHEHDEKPWDSSLSKRKLITIAFQTKNNENCQIYL